MTFKKIYIEISNFCNFNCSFCCQSKRAKRQLSADEFSEIAKKICHFTQHIYLHVLGEPLLHPHLNEILNIASQNNLLVNITTNGSLIEKCHKILAQNDIRQINISLHDWEENIENFEDKLQKIIPLVKTLSEKTYICFRLWNLGNNASKSFNEKCLEILQRNLNVQTDVLQQKTNGNGITLAKNIFLQKDDRFIWPNIDNEKKYPTKNCYALRDHIAILSDGTVVPCCLDANANLPLGNIFDENLEDILQSKRAIKIAEGFKQHNAVEPFCQTCGFLPHGK